MAKFTKAQLLSIVNDRSEKLLALLERADQASRSDFQQAVNDIGSTLYGSMAQVPEQRPAQRLIV